MNHRIVARILSRVALAEALLLLLCALVGLWYGDELLLTYGVPIALLLGVSAFLNLFTPRTRVFYAREGFVAVALSWVLLSLFGALPFWITGAIPSYVDCFFETVSGFTTTGATILADIEALPHGLLFWRSFTHWIGGMGVLVFLMAVTQLGGDRSMHLMRAEAPGPSVGKLVPRARTTAGILYGMYCAMTAAQIILLLLGGMPLFDSVTTAFATAGTGGFSVKNAGIPAYGSVYLEMVILVFMLLFSINFTLYYLVVLKKPKQALKSEELRWFLGVFAVSVLLMAVDIGPACQSVWEALRLSAFQSASIMSTTGFATANFAKWPEFSHTVILLLMIIGSCAGSTGGGFKISRLVILLKSIRREISHMLHPRSVGVIKFEGKPVEAEVSHGVLVYLAVYALLVLGGVLAVSTDGFDHTTNVSAVLTTLNNVGPGLGRVGPMDNFSVYSAFSKGLFAAYMLIGRLEIFPILLLLSPAIWRRK